MLRSIEPHNIAAVVTSINRLSTNMEELGRKSKATGAAGLFLVADAKTVEIWQSENIIFLSLEDQEVKSFGKLGTLLPRNHYSRKNIGYLAAALSGADWIYETDDDNYLLTDTLWEVESSVRRERALLNEPGWANIYGEFDPRDVHGNPARIWARGLPLERINANANANANLINVNPIESERDLNALFCPVICGLVNSDPDVDAIYRLTNILPIIFAKKNFELVLGSNSWAPFNSQNTFWHRSILPLMYLPVSTSFRVTDILRSYVALAIIQNRGEAISFISPNAVQHRNDHNLLDDFEQEVLLYLKADSTLQEIRTSIKDGEDLYSNLRNIYGRLNTLGIVQEHELIVLDEWLAVCKKIENSSSS